ncbi:MAG: DUF4301 family protein [Dysgonomonas sp.]
MFTQQDLNFIKQKGISEKKIQDQLINFKNGFPYLKIASSASIQKGIMQVKNGEKYLSAWEDYRSADKKVVKFVPASGAASRMFKSLFEFEEAAYSLPETSFEKTFFENIEDFAFIFDLDEFCEKNYSKSVQDLIGEKDYKSVVSGLLHENGLNYGKLPKGLLKFHKYASEVRTPVEEHMTEGVLYAKCGSGTVNIHFTVSPEHRTLFESLIKDKKEKYEKRHNVRYVISLSEQKPETDTIAVDGNNEPFREDGQLVFRPGGHGALIENLNDLDADVIFIKNIDNVVLDSFKDTDVHYKKTLAGILIDVQKQIFEYLNLIDSGNYSHEQLIEILYFVQNVLTTKNPETKLLEDAELVLYLKRKLNRPIRVCGMVKNAGEPGGGPFLAYNTDGTISPQILESSQIDMNDPEKKAMFEKGTHFNPVDLVCAVKDYKGNKFDLRKYVDEKTGFISVKSKNGKELKALELPGLWNGAMSDWNTIFVEVPIETFNPVKVINDLLRKEHRGK